jgi:hypothetical protein
MLVEKNDAIATVLGTVAAACECEQDGNIPITPAHVLAKLDKVERQMNFAS